MKTIDDKGHRIENPDKYFNNIKNCRQYCSKCGHTLYFLNKRVKKICEYCATLNYLDNEEGNKQKFMDGLRKANYKQKRKELEEKLWKKN